MPSKKEVFPSTGVQDLPLEALVLGKAQVRTRNLEEGIDELAANISKVGVLEPILVRPSTEDIGKWEVVSGQRRVAACKLAGKTSIPATILNVPDDNDAMVLSVSENMLRLDPDKKDYIDACTALYHKYGDIKVVSKSTGLPLDKVREYIKYDRLKPPLKAVVDEGKADVRVALKVQDVALGKYNQQEAAAIAVKLNDLSGAEQSRIVRLIAEQPKSQVDELLENTRESQIVQILVSLTGNVHQKLKAYAAARKINLDLAAQTLIQAALAISAPAISPVDGVGVGAGEVLDATKRGGQQAEPETKRGSRKPGPEAEPPSAPEPRPHPQRKPRQGRTAKPSAEPEPVQASAA